ncbi:hypothetical protein BN7_1960 [Wickerhamomyces ciferrii]|uniref:Uncharacterized protein n=1 Tax=Wickerhamomyces ciferrii (strain ATCC 14091 / BCRC 22168 / CBS 111 / JCM 3599 / NBRC 0793 / NRRL Y-1031 F-60-10) TaxID=1206466 RepID=K0KBK3_WICCF|nr:uncharacterized protein BN7_1960 [Wickerhamomyces ciferrii]CCH42415.1 hypothetical protein BN7_1960 [Wickerhamomyces ciferrii]
MSSFGPGGLHDEDEQSELNPAAAERTRLVTPDYNQQLIGGSYGSLDGDNETGLAEGEFRQGKNRMKNRYRLQIYLVSLIITFIGCFCIINLLMLIPRSEEFVNQSVEMDIKSVELEHLSTQGILLRVKGVNVMDYDSIESPYFKQMFKMGGGLFNTASINLQTVNLTTKVDGNLINIGDVKIPDFDIDIQHGHETNLDLLVMVRPNTKEIIGLVKQFLKNPDQIFKVDGISTVKIHLGHIPIGEFKIDFSQDVIGGKYIQFNDHDIHLKDLQFDSNQQDQGYNVSFAVDVPNPVKYKLFGFDIPSLGWDILIKDCFGENTINLIDGSITTKKFKLSPLDKILTIESNTLIDHLNPRLLEKCSLDNEGSPMSILVDEFVNNKSLPIKIKNSKGSKDFPGFINEFLKTFEFNFNYSSNFDTANLIHNVSLDRLNFQFENGDTNKPVINGDINLFIKPPFNITDLEINKIKGIPHLYHNDVEFGEIHLDDWHDCINVETPDGLLYVKFTMNQENLQITNRKIFGEVLNEVLGKGSSKIYIDAILDCLINTLMGEFELDKLHASSDADITRGFILRGFGL